MTGSPAQPAILYPNGYAERQGSTSWIISPVPAFGGSRQPTPMAATAQGEPRLVFESPCGEPEGCNIILAGRQGGSWFVDTAGVGHDPTLAFDPAIGAAHVAHTYVAFPGATSRIRYAYNDGDPSWQWSVVPKQSNQDAAVPSLALDIGRVAHIAYVIYDPTSPTPFVITLAHSDGAQTPTFTTEAVSSEPNPINNVTLVYDPLGQVLFSV